MKVLQFLNSLRMAKRITSSSVNWTFISQTLIPEDLAKTVQLRLTTDKYLRELAGKPAELPKIDWNFYKSKISAPGMVESFQKSYEALKIPYPSDQGLLSETEISNAKMNENAKERFEEVLKILSKLQEELKKLESVPRLKGMTMEELYLARPDLRIDLKNYPI